MKKLFPVLLAVLWAGAASAQTPYKTFVPALTTATEPFASNSYFSMALTGGTSTQKVAANTIVTLTGTQTLTNKTISCGANTCTNIPASALTGILSSAQFNSGLTSSILDLIGSTRGSVLYRGAGGWAILPPGISGYFLQTAGAGLDPSWQPSGGGSGITQLTGDVTAGPGTGSQAATLASTAVTPGSYTSTNLTVDAKGRITAASNGSGGGGTAVQSYGTFSGSVGVYTTTGTTPAVSANTEGYRFCGTWPSGLAAPTGTATLAVGTAGALPMRVKSANNGIIAFSGKEIQPGTNGNPYCVQVMSSTWVLDSQAPGGQIVDQAGMTSGNITQDLWASQSQFVQKAASATYNLPASATVSGQAGVTIITGDVTAQLCASGSDAIDSGLVGGGTAGGCITLAADGTYPISLTGTNAYTVPLGSVQYGTATLYGGTLSADGSFTHFAVPRTVLKVMGRVDTASGVLGTADIYATASGAACTAGIKLNNTSFNLNGTANTNFDLALNGAVAAIQVPALYDLCFHFATGAPITNGGAQKIQVSYR